jgi:hypothetical protein
MNDQPRRLVMRIIWTDRPAYADTKVTRVWFEGQSIRYTEDPTPQVVRDAKRKDVQMILDEEAYAKTGRSAVAIEEVDKIRKSVQEMFK